MRRTLRRTLVLSSVTLAAGGWLLFALRPREPSYGGKDLEQWLAELEKNGEEDRSAIEAVRQIGTNAIPMLVKMMQSEDSTLKRTLLHDLQQQRLIKISTMDDTEKHLRARLGFAALGPVARPALPALEPLVLKANITRFAVEALATMGNDGVRAATAGLRSINGVVRRDTAGALGTLGIVRFRTNSTPEQLAFFRSQAEIAIPPLVAACSDADELVRARAAIALGLLGQKPELAVPVLMKMLREESGWRVPSAAARALGRFGTNALSAAAALKESAHNKDSRVSDSAQAALRSIQAPSD